jgi:hypothetical protein
VSLSRAVPAVSLEVLKWGAVGFMVFDHVAAVFIPGNTLLRLPGRVVFPAFAALMALHLSRGYPPERYVTRLFPFALLAQGGYSLAFGMPLVWPLNVLFTLLAAALIARGSLWAGGLLSLFTEFPLGGFTVYWLSRERRWEAALAHMGSMFFMGWGPLVILASGGLLLLAWELANRGLPGRKVPWWAAYAFYPAHLWLLWGLKWLGSFSR